MTLERMDINMSLTSILNYVVLAGIVISAVITVLADRMIDSVLALAAVGSFMAVEFLFLAAPDVAIAEASVGAVLGTVLYMIALYRVAGKEKK